MITLFPASAVRSRLPEGLSEFHLEILDFFGVLPVKEQPLDKHLEGFRHNLPAVIYHNFGV